MNVIKGLVLALCLVYLSGCIYSKITIPLDRNLDRTQMGSKVGRSQFKRLLGLFASGDAGTQASAQNGGLTTLKHPDREILVILGLVYIRQTTIVYGD